MEKSYRRIIYLFIGIIIISFLGFYKTYFGFFPQFKGVNWVVHFHVLVIISWFALLIIQPILIRQQRVALHKRLGRLSYVIAPLIVISFVLMTNYGQLKHKDTGLFGATLFDGTFFLILYMLAIVYKKNTAFHARFMILSAIPFINPGLGRLISPAVSVPVQFLIIITLLIIEYFYNKKYKPYLIALGTYIALMGFIVYISVISPVILENCWQLIWGSAH